ncbi:MAG: glycerol kinase, partial [Tenericutes bacterium HGW-Tenericutes-5]
QKIDVVKATGGATVNNYLMQFQADIMNTKVERPFIMETTALGAAYLAGIASGYWQNIEDIKRSKKEDTAYQPKMEEALRKRLLKGWKLAVEATRHFKI